MLSWLFLAYLRSVCLIRSRQVKKTKYSTIISYFENNEVKDYSLDFGSGDLVLTLRDSETQIKYTVPSVDVFLENCSADSQ